jgi:HlyD family secretion protein
MKRLLLLCVLLAAGCTRPTDNGWLGYAEGETAMIAAPGAGWVSGMTIKRGDTVQKGQTLFRLDDIRQEAATNVAKASLEAANAQIAEARANLAYTQKELTRQTTLVREQAGTVAALDLARSNSQSARARLTQLEAQANQSRANLADTSYQLSERSITARTQGRVEDIFFREGEYAPAMTPVVAILPPENVFVRFFVPESEFSKIRLGQKVAITCDGCAANITGNISFIASKQEFTPPVIFSVGNREKLVFKVEARAPWGLKLNPGQPVQVRPL